jgi:crotonobetainyl-CoA:carnitine CoA-transferase CaiB-like acyl-CoA transferase
MVRISGFGQDGPYRDRPGYGVIGEAMSGLRHITGDPDRPPARVAVSMTDYITGLYAAFGAVMALLARTVTGQGQVVDAALYECAFTFMEPWIPAFDKLGHVAERTGSRLPESTPNNLYPTAEGGFIHIAAPAEGVFRRLLAVMGTPEVADDERFSTSRARSKNHEALDDLIAGWTIGLPLPEAERALIAADVPACRVFTMVDIFADPHFAARGSIVSVPDLEMGTVAMSGVVPRLSGTPGLIRRPGGAIGAETREVLARLPGMSGERLDALANAGIIPRGNAT